MFQILIKVKFIGVIFGFIETRCSLASRTYPRAVLPSTLVFDLREVALLTHTQDPHGGPPNSKPPGLICRISLMIRRKAELSRVAQTVGLIEGSHLQACVHVHACMHMTS